MEQGQKWSWWPAEVPFLKQCVKPRSHLTTSAQGPGQGKDVLALHAREGSYFWPSTPLHSKVDCNPEGNACITAKHSCHPACLHQLPPFLPEPFAKGLEPPDQISVRWFVTTSQRNAVLEF